MNATPRYWALYTDKDLRCIPAPPGYLIIECEIAQPPSSKGRTVYVIFDPEDVTRLVKEARSVAIASRGKTLADSAEAKA